MKINCDAPLAKAETIYRQQKTERRDDGCDRPARRGRADQIFGATAEHLESAVFLLQRLNWILIENASSDADG